MPHFLFPSDPSNPSAPDDFFGEQRDALAGAGFSTSLFAESVFTRGTQLTGIPSESYVVYRGWMLKAEEYRHLAEAIKRAGAHSFTTEPNYLLAHHLPNWYPLIAEMTPETHFIPTNADPIDELKALSWPAFFVKDYVKSLKTSLGSVIRDPSRIAEVIAEMKEYRGEIEGGICVRQMEDFIVESERRYFVIDGRPFSSMKDEIPELVRECARRIPCRFFSVDAIERRDGVMRIVEIGDGQVSDIVGWTPEAFARMWVEAAVH